MPGTTTTSARARSGPHRRLGGLSLVEILVSLAILVVIGAVVVPWSIQWLGGRELDNAEDQLAMQMIGPKKMCATLHFGKRQNQESHLGQLHGAMVVRVGTWNALRWLTHI